MKRPAAVVSAALLVFACKAEPAAEKKAPADTPSSAASKPTTQTKTQGARPASKPVVKTPGEQLCPWHRQVLRLPTDGWGMLRHLAHGQPSHDSVQNLSYHLNHQCVVTYLF